MGQQCVTTIAAALIVEEPITSTAEASVTIATKVATEVGFI